MQSDDFPDVESGGRLQLAPVSGDVRDHDFLLKAVGSRRQDFKRNAAVKLALGGRENRALHRRS
jgi:hypothetical protein